MATRTVYIGDTFPAVLLQVSDETLAVSGPLNLSTASSITVDFVGKKGTFTSPGTAIWPPQSDPDGVHKWNLLAPLVAGDTAVADTYDIFVVVTWPTNNVQTFPCTDQLIVKAQS